MATAIDNLDSPTTLLRAAYTQLAFDQGALLPATPQPQPGSIGDWLDRGDWQSLAAQVGAEKIFFVDRDPVVVFVQSTDDSDDLLRKLYGRVWCMARPQLLFLATPGQLVVYDLTKAPPKAEESLDARDRLVAVANSIAEVQSKLAAYHRERIETGAVFGDDRFRDSSNRADRALIRDLKVVRQQLAGLQAQSRKNVELYQLHSLIGRAIFVRYLEDRKILVPEYFENVAARRKEWERLLAKPPSAPAFHSEMAELRFLRVLQNKEFTYALFDQLADDFNGDTFPIEAGERDCIQQEHLDQLLAFLLGSTSGQQELFFFAYRFDVIPIELISAIYEEFYNERIGKEHNQGSHYTPPALVEFVLAQTLTPEVLATRPRVFDPACGSGIFLVESFRRIVRHLWGQQNGKRVSRPQLRKILREQIAGIDINEEAVRVAAFSLYLAFLHYQEPREINAERRLPYLKWVNEQERNRRDELKPDGQFFDVLLHANAFDAISGAASPEVARRFGPGSAAVVVGNPPWGYPKKNDKPGQRALEQTLRWCDPNQGRPVGDKELSQAFIHLALALLQDGGRAGMLVSSGVFFKHHRTSKSFRNVWLTSARLEHVVNFAHVRKIFFSGPQREAQGISPFVSVVFERSVDGSTAENVLQYWSIKRTSVIENTKCVVLSHGDMHFLSQRDCLADERLWKIYWWGGHMDERLVRKLDARPRLIQLLEALQGPDVRSGRGFEATQTGSPSGWLKDYCELPAKSLVRYGRQSLRDLRAVPDRVYRQGFRPIYSGRRLLVARGIKSGGRIVARFETQKYCFRNSIHGVQFEGLEKWQEDVVTAVFWSSLARYFYFTTSGSWGFWHDELHLEDIEQMPIHFPGDVKIRNRIGRIVSALQELDEQSSANLELFQESPSSNVRDLEESLDEAVFDLYALTPAERDLIRDKCSIGLDLFYQSKGRALREVSQPSRSAGRWEDLCHSDDGLSAYLRTFLEIWNAELAPDGEFVWRVLSPPTRAPLLAVSFTTRYKGGRSLDGLAEGEGEEWSNVLARVRQHSLVPAGTSRIFIDTFFRYVSNREILFVKRNESRFWTRSAAREDAESALTHLMNLEDIIPTARQ